MRLRTAMASRDFVSGRPVALLQRFGRIVGVLAPQVAKVSGRSRSYSFFTTA